MNQHKSNQSEENKTGATKILAMGDFYMWFTLVQMSNLSNFNVVHVCCDSGQLRWRWYVEIAWSPAQRYRAGNKKCRRKCAEDYDLQAAPLECCTL